jgi:SAM-dependent methyltransferase
MNAELDTKAGIPPGFRERACPVCGPGVSTTVFAESNYDPAKLNAFSFASRKSPELMHYRLLRCDGCDVLYASPAPILEEMHVGYEEASFDSAEEAGYAARTYAGVLKRMALPTKHGALDVGTGDGAFLRCLIEAGFTDVRGIEPSKAPVAAAAPDVAKLIELGFFERGRYPADSLSLLTCFQTMEHVDEPGMVAEEALRLLRPGGIFYTVCHSSRSLSAKLLGMRSPIFDLEHLQLFSPKSLRKLLESRGYEDVQVFYVSNVYPLHYWLKVFPLPNVVRSLALRLLKALRLHELPIPMRAGNLAGFGRKPK